MIERYSREKISKIWTDENKFNTWLAIELAACKAHVKLGNISQKDFDTIKKKASFKIKRIKEIEKETNHDVIAFLTNLAENIGPSSRFVHLGLTSSDIVDTALSVQTKNAGIIIKEGIENLLKTIKEKAIEHKTTIMMGRTHGVHAEPTTLGLKLTVWYEEMKRNKERLENAIKSMSVGKLSGAVGNYTQIPPELETDVCKELNLTPSLASTQILQRDRHAEFISCLAIIGGSLEKYATEIRALQKTEFNEITEPFSKKQKGSSAMPHKRNPIICERVTGLARTIRGYAITALENQNLWHERDISHSSTERIIFPDATIAIDYMIYLMTNVIGNMKVNKDQLTKNIDKSFNIFFSQPLLLRLINKGLIREEAYEIVQKIALEAFDTQIHFDKLVKKNNLIQKHLNQDELNKIFNFENYTKHINHIFKRVYS